MSNKATSGYVKEENGRWNCYVTIDGKDKHVGFAHTEKRALAILRSSLEIR